MPIRVPSHLYRNRHGVFYFRFIFPPGLRATIGRGEVRLSLQTERRQDAIIAALPLIADLPRLAVHLQRMLDNDQIPPPDYFKLWRDELFKGVARKEKIALLEAELEEHRERMAGMVTLEKAMHAGKVMHDRGQLRGKQALEKSLVFPWPPERTSPFSVLVKAYLASFNYRAKGGIKKPVGAKTLDGYTKDLQLFVSVMGDANIGLIDREVAGEYFNILRRLPPNISRVAKYKGKTIAELLALNDPPQSEVNASKKLERISGMFKWALEDRRKWGIDANPFIGFGQSGDSGKKRRPFTDDEFLTLLRHPSYLTKQFTSAYSFWLIPLAVFTGARLGELCQLDLKDFVQIEGVDCIDINDTEASDPDSADEGRSKRLKTKNAKRLVPIHPELIRLGLLRYVEAKRKHHQVYLFPELSRARRDGPSHAASNWFQRFRDKVGITGKQETVFHSFRHGFITTVLDSGVSPHTVAPIVGHEAELVTGQVYWNKKDATKRKPTVDAFTLSPDILALLPAVEEVTFVTAPGRRPGRKTEKI